MWPKMSGNLLGAYVHAYICTCMVHTFHIFQNLVQITTECALGHENTKYAEVLQYKSMVGS